MPLPDGFVLKALPNLPFLCPTHTHTLPPLFTKGTLILPAILCNSIPFLSTSSDDLAWSTCHHSILGPTFLVFQISNIDFVGQWTMDIGFGFGFGLCFCIIIVVCLVYYAYYRTNDLNASNNDLENYTIELRIQNKP